MDLAPHMLVKALRGAGECCEAMRIEDYSLIGDCRTGALVSTRGSIDWLCLPRFDSPACFAALLGNQEHGCWEIRPRGEIREVHRRYHGYSPILETEFTTTDGVVRLIDFMPTERSLPQVVRIVRGLRGRVPMQMLLTIRFDYGLLIPWVRSCEGGISAVAGPHAVHVRSDVKMTGRDMSTVAEFTVAAEQQNCFVLSYSSSFEPAEHPAAASEALEQTADCWKRWIASARHEGEHRDAVLRSLVTLKGLSYAPTGGLIAALTTSLPECLGGQRNWDYRYCWIRDGTFTLYALIESGFTAEAVAWRDWLARAVAGEPSQTQALYAVDANRWLREAQVPWLPGYEGSRPVRIGNGAVEQLQLDVYGEIMDTLHVARTRGLPPDENTWRIQKVLMGHLEKIWRQPDNGIWEIPGARRHMTHSKIMVWVAFDRAVKAVERFGLDGPVERWRALRQEVHDDVCERGFDAEKNSFVQVYGSREVDASLLLIPALGFLPPGDPRVRGTIEAIERELLRDGLVRRYRTESGIDSLPGDEGAFLLCSFWLADAWTLMGRHQQAEQLFAYLLSLRNEVGLLPEQYDTSRRRFLGNFPQAFSHVALINTARNLAADETSPLAQRGR